MRWIRRLLGADTPHEVGQRTPEVPLFDRDTPRMETTPARPFVCRVVSSSERGMTYTVEVDETDKWTCTCPDYAHERAGPGRSRYFCKHCIRVGYVTGLKQPRRWRRQRGEGWLIGEMVALDNGSRMKVDGFVTSRELYGWYAVHVIVEQVLTLANCGRLPWHRSMVTALGTILRAGPSPTPPSASVSRRLPWRPATAVASSLTAPSIRAWTS